MTFIVTFKAILKGKFYTSMGNVDLTFLKLKILLFYFCSRFANDNDC